MADIRIVYMDITKIGHKADVIVNAANETLLGGGGVDGAIHRAAGPALLEECRLLNGCRPGEAKVTKAYNLDNKYIIHTVGPRYYSDSHPEETLFNCYYNSLLLAESLKVKSIAFPSISTGVFGYPLKEASEICLRALESFPYKNIETVYICLYLDKEALNVFQETFKKYHK